jgi:hypothetical protein
MMRCLLVLAALAPAVTAAHAETLRCEITSKFMCELTACQAAKLGGYNLVDLDKNTIARCDRLGCDTYDAVVSASGAFLNVAVPDRGLMAKLSLSLDSFTEVVTLAGQVYVSFGRCGQMPE